MRFSPSHLLLLAAALASASCQSKRTLADFGDIRVSEFGLNEFASALPTPKKILKGLSKEEESAPDSSTPGAQDEAPVISDTDPVIMMARAQADAESSMAPAPMLISTHPGMDMPSPAPAPIAAASPPQPAVSTIESARDIKQATPKDFVVKTTAYTHLEADSLPYGTKSAIGEDLKFGMIRSAAADWSRYPVGTRFKIKGLPYEYVVEDYGSALVGTDTIDLYKPNFSSMNQWGARDVGIEVLEWGSFEESKRILDSRKHKASADHVRQMLRSIEEKIEQIPLELRDGFSA